jgi:selenocysteine lyase/cysteine desulfurase
VTFLAQGIGPGAVKAALARKRINVSVSDAAWTRIDMDARGIPALVRASVHYYNSEEEVNAFAAAVAALLGRNGATPPE